MLDKVGEQPMRKRSKYRPKRNLLNPVGFVLEGLTPVRAHASFMVDLKIKNHGAMAALMQGRAAKTDIDTLISMINITEALYRMGFGEDYGDIVANALTALRDVGARGADTGKFILKASEIKALNEAMELHDAQMDVITLNDMDRAIALVTKEFERGKMTPIVAREGS
jgi:hypothetical protein